MKQRITDVGNYKTIKQFMVWPDQFKSLIFEYKRQNHTRRCKYFNLPFRSTATVRFVIIDFVKILPCAPMMRWVRLSGEISFWFEPVLLKEINMFVMVVFSSGMQLSMKIAPSSERRHFFESLHLRRIISSRFASSLHSILLVLLTISGNLRSSVQISDVTKSKINNI